MKIAKWIVGSVVASVLTCGLASAQLPAFQPPKEISAPDQKGAIPLLANPDTSALPEQWEMREFGNRAVRNVSHPTLTPFLPNPAKANGAAVIVAPGGAFHILAIDHEGYQVARWLADHGIAAFVLKYRTIPAPRDQQGFNKAIGAYMQAGMISQKFETPVEALLDAQAAVRMVRARSKAWRVDPSRVGFVGFSAGAMTTLSVGLAPEKDARPDFIAPIYPPMVALDVPADAPPMFLAIALDDDLFAKGRPLALIESWRNAKRPLEVHLYEKGNHGFGMSNRSATSALWIDEFQAWMKDRGLLKPKP
jgi:acetyl esterase/lipase